MDLGDSMDQPFHNTPNHVLEGDVEYSGGVQVAAAVVELPGVGKKPVLVFTFAKPDGTMRDPIALVADDAQMARLIPLVTAAVNRARRVAGKP